jgi:hypothetical protein
VLLAHLPTTAQTETHIVRETLKCSIHRLDQLNGFLGINVIWAKPLLTAAALDHRVLITGMLAVCRMTLRSNKYRIPSLQEMHITCSFLLRRDDALLPAAKTVPISAR